MLGLVFLERLRACARLPRPPGSARAGRRVTGEEIMQELRETTSRLVNIATGGCLSRELPGEHRPRERWSVVSYGRRRGLRPVSLYAIVLALAIALTASFFLPLRAEAAISDHTVPTISPSGTTINLFDYWVNPDDHLSVSGSGGVNAGHKFQFNDGKGDGRSTNGRAARARGPASSTTRFQTATRSFPKPWATSPSTTCSIPLPRPARRPILA